MNKKPYSQILDAVAGDRVPNDLNLAPNILARVQKGKGIAMQPRIRMMTAVLLLMIALAILFVTVPSVAAAIQRWFGYVPGVGLVRDGQIRVLEKPVSVTREGVTVTVDQVILNQERTALVYSVEGIPGAALNLGTEKDCDYKASLRLPDGSPLLASPQGLQFWSTGYQHRFDFPPISTTISDAKLVISCLYQTRPGSAPENWEIPLHFVPSSPDVTAFPVIEIPTATALPAAVTPTAAPAATIFAGTATVPVSISESAPAVVTLTLDRAVQMDDGYLLYATLHWKGTPYNTVDLSEPTETLHLLDGTGHEMLYELRNDEQTGMNVDQRQTVFAIKTAPVQASGPLTLILDAVLVEQPAQANFVFDPGPNPKPGQQWRPDAELIFGQRRLRVRTVIASESGYELEMASDSGILNAGCADADPNHPIVSGYSGGGGRQGKGYTFGCGFNYQNGLPTGPITISVGSISVQYAHQLKAQWTPPAASPNLLPTQPAACLTVERWKSAQGAKPPLPAGVSGKVLFSTQLDSGEWTLILSNLDGSSRQEFAGAQDGALSPDGTKLAYSAIKAGITIVDLATGKANPLPGTSNGDFNPVWSPDASQIVFNRGKGIFDLFIMNQDGSNMRQLTKGGVQEWPVGWLPDGKLLYSVPGREYESTIYQVNVQSGESKKIASDDMLAISPDGRYIASRTMVFGDRWQVNISDLDGSNRWLLADARLWVLDPTWSPDGQWLLAEVSDTDAGSTTGALIDLRTCQVIPLPALKGTIRSWVK